tara:strand:+ start:69392 stop:70660 length:1269 start_codon:yes stop_codon:yes gene_type:complete
VKSKVRYWFNKKIKAPMNNTAQADYIGTNVFDDKRSIAYALFLALVGYAVMVAIPVISTAWVNMLGFTEEQVGRVAGADLLGLSLGAVLTSVLVAKVNRKGLTLVGLLISIVANGLCIVVVDYEQTLWLRLVAGFASGIFTATAIVTLGGVSKPVRAFNLLLLAFAFSTAIELHFLPKLSMAGIYWFFISLSVVCVLFLHWLPSRPQSEAELAMQEAAAAKEDGVENWQVPKFIPFACLFAIALTYVNIGGYFTYIELAAHADGVAKEWVGPVLTWSSLFTIVGCVLAAMCGRLGLFKPLFIAYVLMATAVLMLGGGITNTKIAVSLFIFMAMWTFGDIFQYAMIAHMDKRGTYIALVPSVQGFGQFIGPNVAASILGAGLGYNAVFIVCGLTALLALLVYVGIFIYMHRRKLAHNEAVKTA